MGVMIDGVYQVEDPAPQTDADGQFRRAASTIRHWITPEGPFYPEPGRYHLYAAWNCPWAHRALLGRAVMGLENQISVSYALPRRTPQGWVFDAEGAFADGELGVLSLHEVYARQSPSYTGRITVPVPWDRDTQQIVSNESADILRMLGQGFDAASRLYPAGKAEDIDRWNASIYPEINNGVYRAGFARTQSAYDEAVIALFEALDRIEAHLADSACLVGDHVTEADLRLFPTLARFDVAYHYAFKCNIRKLSEYPHLWDYARALYALPGVAATVKPEIYKQGYFSPSELRNPLGIVPAGPMVHWEGPTERKLTLAP
ncbi:glutathione S-transferase C-terminal domain-containing protein [uncultured Shimia sp.]|uniref:glutathione S-transferase family protein n=1 Tax=uncultured Shimia sp. TaxID=573152 RepID=UPI0026167BC6|nr:glutathione S-transferase C-terminal domain-containing protein [uncultured Shimia sp.]